MSRCRLILAAACLAAALATPAAVYNGGRCDGAISLYGGEYMRFQPGENPVPRFLWILVQEGGGNVILQDSNGAITTSMYLGTYDLLLFDAREWMDLYYQGSYCKLFYGGANVNALPQPVCSTGSLGPVLLLTDELRNVAVQSGAPGPPGIRVSIYQRGENMMNGDLAYKRLSQLALWSDATSEACSGSSCCNPTHTAFFIKNATGWNFTGFLMDSANTAPFDWFTVPAPPLLCEASAEPTSGTVPVTVEFRAQASGGTGDFRYDWRFGDGKVGTGERVSHTYRAGGVFTWKLTVTDQADKTCQSSGQLSFLSPLSVTATATPRQGEPPLTVNFSCAPQGGRAPYAYEWLFGDGDASSAASPTHTYLEAGRYEALVTVTDADGMSAATAVPVYCGIPVDPTVAAIQKLTGPFRLKVVGADFEPGCVLLVEGAPVPQTAYKSSTKLVAKKGASLKALFPKGVPRCVTVHNPSGGTSACYTFTR